MIYLKLFILLIFIQLRANELQVKITKDTQSITVNHLGKAIVIKRVQDTGFMLTDDYTKTSRLCPPFCIHPITVAKGVNTIGEVELISYYKHEIKDKKALLIDARLPSWYKLETIPTAINIPFTFVERASKKAFNKFFEKLGAKKINNNWDYKEAKVLIAFCNGVWCDQSPRFIKAMLKAGYPANKLIYYRDGFQGWKLLGLTTVINKKEEVP